MMGWTISVGTAEARNTAASSKRTGGRAQALSVWIDAHGVIAQVKVSPNAGRTTSSHDAGSIPAWQAQFVWQNVLSTLVGT
jgi:hypothetical protein